MSDELNSLFNPTPPFYLLLLIGIIADFVKRLFLTPRRKDGKGAPKILIWGHSCPSLPIPTSEIKIYEEIFTVEAIVESPAVGRIDSFIKKGRIGPLEGFRFPAGGFWCGYFLFGSFCFGHPGGVNLDCPVYAPPG